MKYKENNGIIEITDAPDFDPQKIFECGQCFRWDADKTKPYIYTGVAKGRAAQVQRRGDTICITSTKEDFETIWRDYFDLDRDYEAIRKKLSIDDFMHKATLYGAGIRILKQDPWEALCSFIISQCNNISRIKKIINTLCLEFGQEFQVGDTKHYTFPTAQTLAKQTEEDLTPLRCGYRAAYILKAALAVANGEIDLEEITKQPQNTARLQLKKLHGVGDKVADCVMLFGLNKLDAFPIDVWMKRAIAQHYNSNFNPNIFTPYAGIAQQYMFNYMRNAQTNKQASGSIDPDTLTKRR